MPGWICRDDVVIVQRLLNQLIAQDIRDFRVLAAIAKSAAPAVRGRSHGPQGLGQYGSAHRAWSDHLPAPYSGAYDGTADPERSGPRAGRSAQAQAIRPRCWPIWWSMSTGRADQVPVQFQARRRLRQLDLHNVSAKHGNGWLGWPNKGPFDAILVTAAAASEVPKALTDQLADGGRLVLPVGDSQQTPCS